MRTFPRASLVFMVLMVVTGSARQQRATIDVDPAVPYEHKPSGMVFPPTAGAMNRTNVNRYDEEATDVSATYKHSELSVVATVYVFPTAGEELQQHFEVLRRQLDRVHGDVAVITEGAWEFKQGDCEYAGLRGIYRIGDFNKAGEEMVSETYLLRIGDRFVKYRISYPADAAEAAAKLIPELQAAIRLPPT